MSEVLNELALELRSIFAKLYGRNVRTVTFNKYRNTRSQLLGIRIAQPGQWPEASYVDMNTALLSLHHNGYIVYGANTITLKQKLLEIQPMRIQK